MTSDESTTFHKHDLLNLCFRVGKKGNKGFLRGRYLPFVRLNIFYHIYNENAIILVKMLVSGLKRMFYNGLPVCAMCERVNRYV